MSRAAKLRKQLLAGPFIFWIVAFTLIPLAMMVYRAFTDGSGAFTLANVAAIARPTFLKALGLSLELALISTAICLLLAYPVALILRKASHGRGAFFIFVFVLPMWMNFLLRTMAWQSLLEREGVVNGILSAIGLPGIEIINTPGAIVLGMVYNFLPFMILPLYNSITKIDDSTINAAYDLGANRIQTVFRVIVPQSLAGIVSGITMVFVPSLTTFVVSDILGGGKVMLIGNIIEQQFTVNYDWNLGAGLSIVLMIFVLISMALVNSFDKSGEGRLL
jgi:spermidine/putrescine transport system permease protein